MGLLGRVVIHFEAWPAKPQSLLGVRVWVRFSGLRLGDAALRPRHVLMDYCTQCLYRHQDGALVFTFN